MRTILTITAISIIFLTACEVKQKEYKPENDFIKIFNDSEIKNKYFPVGMVQTNDGGYLVVSALKNDTVDNEFPTTHIFKTDRMGQLEWTNKSPLLAPAQGIFYTSLHAGYIAMDGGNNGYLVLIDLSDGNEMDRIALGQTMPIAFSHDDQKIAVLGYDYINRASTFFLYSTDNFQSVSQSSMNVNDDVRPLIQGHMNRSGTQFPFFIGRWENEGDNGYFVNCFDNYTLRVDFFNSNANRTGGSIYSFQTEAALSSLIFKQENIFSFTRYYQGENYVVPAVEVNTSISQNFNDITGFPLPELASQARVYSNIIYDRDTTMVFTSNTNKNSIQLYKFKLNEEELSDQFEIPFDVKTELGGAIVTEDLGMAILARVFVLGKYPRPAIIKVPSEKFK